MAVKIYVHWLLKLRIATAQSGIGLSRMQRSIAIRIVIFRGFKSCKGARTPRDHRVLRIRQAAQSTSACDITTHSGSIASRLG
jgi:hypothetical protein